MDSRITRGRGNTPLPTHTPGSSRQPPPKPTLSIGGMGVPVEQLKPSPDWKVHRSKRSRYRVLCQWKYRKMRGGSYRTEPDHLGEQEWHRSRCRGDWNQT